MDRLEVITSESERLSTVLAAIDPTTPCPTCPDWTASDLLWHFTEVHFFWATVLSSGVLTDDDIASVEDAKPDRPAALPDLLRLRRDSTAMLIDQLVERVDAERCWSWWPADQTVGFTRRMQTYEATMHRVDAELTAGIAVGPIAPDVATGAVDHAVDVMWGWRPDGVAYQPECTVEFVATDVPASWLVEVGTWSVSQDGRRGMVATRAAGGEPTATVRAPTNQLALWAWTRGGTVDVTGRHASVEALNDLLAQGIQ